MVQTVNSEIYWDPKYNIEKAYISIYNIMGSKIEGKAHINIKKQSNWNGILTWHCGGVSEGTYFIVIKFGTTTKTISVLVSK